MWRKKERKKGDEGRKKKERKGKGADALLNRMIYLCFYMSSR